MHANSSSSAPTDHAGACWSNGPSWSWPEKRTMEVDSPVTCEKRMASRATATPSTGITSSIRGSACARTRRAVIWIACPTNGASAPNTSA